MEYDAALKAMSIEAEWVQAGALAVLEAGMGSDSVKAAAPAVEAFAEAMGDGKAPEAGA